MPRAVRSEVVPAAEHFLLESRYWENHAEMLWALVDKGCLITTWGEEILRAVPLITRCITNDLPPSCRFVAKTAEQLGLAGDADCVDIHYRGILGHKFKEGHPQHGADLCLKYFKELQVGHFVYVALPTFCPSRRAAARLLISGSEDGSLTIDGCPHNKNTVLPRDTKYIFSC